MIKAENDITLVRVDNGQDGDDGKSAYEAAIEGGYTGEEEQFNSDLAEVPNKAGADALEEVAAGVDITEELISELQENTTEITENVGTLNTSVDNLNAEAEELREMAEGELVARGYANITNEPSLELGRGSADWKIKITNQSVDLQKAGSSGAKLSPNPDRTNETLFRADSVRLANMFFRSADNQGHLGIVAQSNGHISLKEI